MSRCDHKPLNLPETLQTFQALLSFLEDVLIVSFQAKNCPELVKGLDLVVASILQSKAVTRKPLPEEQCTVSLAVNDLSLAVNDLSLAVNDLSLAVNDLSLAVNDLSLAVNDLSLVHASPMAVVFLVFFWWSVLVVGFGGRFWS
jgi:hypothetical protein